MSIPVELYVPNRSPNLCQVIGCDSLALNRLHGRIIGSDTRVDVMVCNEHALTALEEIRLNGAEGRT